MYDNNMIMSLKQKKRKFEPRIKLNHNMYTALKSAVNRRFFAPETPYSIQTGHNLPDVRDLKYVCCFKKALYYLITKK